MPFMLLSSQGDQLCIQAMGRIAVSNVPGEHDALPALTGPAGYAGKTVLGLERVDFIDSAGIGWLLANHKRFKQAGGMLVLHSVPEAIMLTLKLLRLNAIFQIAESEEQAMTIINDAS
jgi:anti-sigma B factor antagonist